MKEETKDYLAWYYSWIALIASLIMIGYFMAEVYLIGLIIFSILSILLSYLEENLRYNVHKRKWNNQK